MLFYVIWGQGNKYPILFFVRKSPRIPPTDGMSAMLLLKWQKNKRIFIRSFRFFVPFKNFGLSRTDTQKLENTTG